MNKTCKQCSTPYTYSEEEQEFVAKISPVVQGQKYIFGDPLLCPICRQIRRFAWRNERFLYHRKCDLSGKPIISIYHRQSPYTIYESSEWWSDKWDALEYGRDFDFSRPFFEQFAELQKVVPRLNLISANNDNSSFTNYVSHLKDCYLLFSADYNRDCYYGIWVENSQNCVDNLMIDNSELAYGCCYAQKLYKCIYVFSSSNCSDSSFLYDCKNSRDCFMSYGLRNKQYYIRNKAYSKKDYEAEMQKINLGSNESFTKLKQEFYSLIGSIPRLYVQKNGRVENSTGNFLTDTENCYYSFQMMRAKDCRYVQGGFDIQSAMHCSYVSGSFGYENCESVPMPYNSAFNVNSYTGHDLFYTDTCMNNSSYLFGCVGLKHKEYCILNKQYSPEEYEVMLSKIIQHMKATGEWGEFFPMSISPFAYNETVAQEIFPLTEQKTQKIGLAWRKEDELNSYEGPVQIVPDSIVDTDEKITQNIFTCQETGKPYKVIPEELRFYKMMNLPLPRLSPDQRFNERRKMSGRQILAIRNCCKCQVALPTALTPTESEMLYCDTCYQGLILN